MNDPVRFSRQVPLTLDQVHCATQGAGALVIRCLFHVEDTPSLLMRYYDGSLKSEGGDWRCLGCGRSGTYALAGETGHGPDERQIYELAVNPYCGAGAEP